MTEDEKFVLQTSLVSQIRQFTQGPRGDTFLCKFKAKKRKLVFKYVAFQDKAQKEQFIREVKLLKECVHPALAHYEGYNPPGADNKCMIATSYIATTLEEILKRISSGEKFEFGPTQMIIITLGIISGLKFLHSLKITHKNLKPSNVLIDKNFRPLVSDFYLNFHHPQIKSLYYPDEEMMQESDIFAYGTILYEMFTGKVINGSQFPQTKPSLPTHLPMIIRKIISACWSENPMHRPSANDIFQLLSINLDQINPDSDISVTRTYLSLLLAFERERLMSIYGDPQCTQNFGKFLLDTSSCLSYQVMGNRFINSQQHNPPEKSPSMDNVAHPVKKGTKEVKKKGRVSKPSGSDSGGSSPRDVSGSKKKKAAGKTSSGGQNASTPPKPKNFTEDPFEASKNGDVPSMKYILSCTDFDVSQKNKSGLTVFHIAAQLGKVDMLKAICSCVKPQTVIDLPGDWGRTALHYAAEAGQLEAVQYIVQMRGGHGFPVSDDGRTPLHDATTEGRTDVIKFLLSCKDVDANKRDENGYTALHFACEGGHLQAAQVLLNFKGTNPNERDEEGATPLHYACAEGRVDVVSLLVECKQVDVNCTDSEGRTPLHYAAFQGQLAAVQKLLSCKGIDINARNSDGQTASDISTNSDITALLISKGKK
ncbi:protein kinase, putative [Trichomonas vaginalis G3]|uniref:Protein kinase, putative n=1 Tax=Trichomonas vaginalis (strain ATCC PRA-98 / G3) TaxID=412133 RepID=A2D9E5_TRIV3|nr:protein ubiquitination [Trichomonas vaginalis G3]EAY22801.1 protein kinase, putative [Trichomonas vaginalis G3]KAI5526958.1 protein ubiquitination [Trichomonas vaginalis G3]|eukprot:XP_001583787.1 protein kinase [Trichomonas vaginalis G3]